MKGHGEGKATLRSRVVGAVLNLGPCTAQEVIALVGRHVPAAQAIVAGRARLRHERARGKRTRVVTTPALIRLGLRELVEHNLRRACRQGKVRRVASGVYAPPELKLYEPMASA